MISCFFIVLYLLARAAKHNKKVLLIGDLGDWMRAHRYPEQNEIEENVIVSVSVWWRCKGLGGGVDYSFPPQDYQDG